MKAIHDKMQEKCIEIFQIHKSQYVRDILEIVNIWRLHNRCVHMQLEQEFWKLKMRDLQICEK